MRAMLTACLSVAVALAPAVVPAATEQSGFYLVPGTPVAATVCSPDCLGITYANIGGHTFSPTGLTPTKVVINDITAGPVWFSVTQDLDGDGISGNNDIRIGPFEPRVTACGNVTGLDGSVVPFDASVALDVSVSVVEPSCEGAVATAGRITVSYG